MTIRIETRNLLRRLGKGLLPQALFLPGLPQPAPLEIKIDTLPMTDVARQQARQAQRPVVAVIDQGLTLRRRISLPKAVGAKADAAIGLQLRQTLPSQGQGLIWRAAVSGKFGDMTEHSVYILKQAQLDILLGELRTIGANVEAVRVGADGVKPIWQRSPDQTRSARNWQAFTGLSVAMIGLVAVIGVERDRIALSDLVSSRAERLAELEARLTTQRETANADQQSAMAVLRDMDLFAAQSRRLNLLSDLTAALPDSVWVSELSIFEDRLTLSGFASGDVGDVISTIQNLPWAKDVKLNGSINFDSYSGQNRFELGLQMNHEAPA